MRYGVTFKTADTHSTVWFSWNSSEVKDHQSVYKPPRAPVRVTVEWCHTPTRRGGALWARARARVCVWMEESSLRWSDAIWYQQRSASLEAAPPQQLNGCSVSSACRRQRCTQEAALCDTRWCSCGLAWKSGKTRITSDCVEGNNEHCGQKSVRGRAFINACSNAPSCCPLFRHSVD